MKKGDLIRVYWVDIAAWPTSTPEEAHPVAMRTTGHFAGWFTDKKRGRYLCLSDTICESDHGKEDVFYGTNAFPKGCIKNIEELIVRVKKKKSTPKPEGDPNVKQA